MDNNLCFSSLPLSFMETAFYLCFCFFLRSPLNEHKAFPRGRRWWTGLDLRDRWVGPAATCSSRLSDSSCLSLPRSNSLTNSQSRIQSHSFKNINAYTPTQPFTPNNQLCSDAQLKEQHAPTLFFTAIIFFHGTQPKRILQFVFIFRAFLIRIHQQWIRSWVFSVVLIYWVTKSKPDMEFKTIHS